MNARIATSVLALLAMLSAENLHAEDPAALSHNPFDRPPSKVTIDAGRPRAPDGSIQVINLQATMVVANSSLANVDGRILRPGDDIDGHTLLQVFEDRAIFSRDGKRVTVFVKPERIETDD